MNIANWIDEWAVATPDKTALIFNGQETSYSEFDDQIKSYARMLKHGLNLQPGDRIAYLGQNHPNSFILLFACARLGTILVPLNWRLTATEHLHILKDSGACVLFVAAPYHDQCESLRGELGECQFVSVEDEKKEHWLNLSELLQNASGDDSNPDIGLESPLLIVYTSGTTGFPKGAVLTQESIECNAYNSTIMHDMTSADIIMTFLPLFHVGGLNNQSTPGFHSGATVILHEKFDPEQILHDVVVRKSTLMIVLPAHMPLLREFPGWEEADLSPVRAVLTGSTAIADEMIRYWHDKGIPLLQVYGSTETCPIAIHNMISNAFETEGTIGFAAMHCEIRVVDGDDKDCAANQPGEFLVRGKNVMSHYWNNPDATNKSLVDGWFHTGDIGYQDDRGCYHFVERKQDVIISGSENIYPAEIENVLMDHPEIHEVSVVGREDQRWGEVPVAVVVKTEQSDLNGGQVKDWLEDKLAHYKQPKDFLFVDELPRNAMRKVLKKSVRELVSNAGSGIN